MTTAEFLSRLSERYPDLPLLIISTEFPPSFNNHIGKILFLGSEFPAQPLLSQDFRFVRAESTQKVIEAVERIRLSLDYTEYSIVYIDHDHELSSVISQINAALSISSTDVVFLFDDAVPPTIGMAGPVPTQPWWVGEVWMLAHILRPASDRFFCTTSNLSPTGLLAAAGFLPAPTDVRHEYDALNAVQTDDHLQKIIQLVDPGEMLLKIERSLFAGALTVFVPLGEAKENDRPLFERRLIREPHPWVRPPPAFILDLSRQALDVSYVVKTTRQEPGKFIDSFTGTYIVGFDGFIKDNTYFSHWTYTAESRLNRIASARESYDNQESGILMLAATPNISRDRLEQAIHINESVMLGTPDEPDNWGMWILLAIPSLHEFLNRRSDYEKYMSDVSAPWKRKLLEVIGLNPNDLIEHDRKCAYFCDKATIIRKSFRDLSVSEDERSIFRSLSVQFGQSRTTAESRKIFVSRLTRTRKMGSYRGLVNEEELISGMQGLGFVVIEPEFLSFTEQVACFRGAEVVVGLGGAAMFNVVFCRPGTKVVTIESTTVFVDAHANLFASVGLEYGIILGEEDVTDTSAAQKKWKLDVPPALAKIAEFIK